MDTAAFTLDPTLEKDTVEITRLGVCRVLLMRDQTYPWVILVPAIAGLRDFDDLNPTHRNAVTAEIDRASKALKAACQPYKINVAALGNVVEQLHIHVIARFQNDAAWPGPVWGVHPPQDYDENARAKLTAKIKSAL
ncbi:HIT family protein [Magnetovibrio sp. PR-2]|uniref:HIT family protein n=1 Tax=Magnetovibrio sp. PR-2 TaxID=3120356 RepID=UPI002FCE3235